MHLHQHQKSITKDNENKISVQIIICDNDNKIIFDILQLISYLYILHCVIYELDLMQQEFVLIITSLHQLKFNEVLIILNVINNTSKVKAVEGTCY